MTHVAHQCICMQYLLELAKQLETDPRACISSFFTKIQVADQSYKDAFYSELEAFKLRIVNRAKEKIAEQEKLVAGLTKAQETFDVQRKRAADREKELLEERTAQEQIVKGML